VSSYKLGLGTELRRSESDSTAAPHDTPHATTRTVLIRCRTTRWTEPEECEAICGSESLGGMVGVIANAGFVWDLSGMYGEKWSRDRLIHVMASQNWRWMRAARGCQRCDAMRATRRYTTYSS